MAGPARAIPTFYSSSFSGIQEKIMYDPQKEIERINSKILENNYVKEKKELISMIALSALAFAVIGTNFYFLGASNIFSYLPLIIVSGIILSDINQINNFKKCLKNCKEIENEIDRLPKDKFHYVYKDETDAGIEIAEYNTIKKYFPNYSDASSNSINLPIIKTKTYEILTGNIYLKTNRELKLDSTPEEQTNIDSVKEQYMPWINLLFAVDKSQKMSDDQKLLFGQLISSMIHPFYRIHQQRLKNYVQTDTQDMYRFYFDIECKDKKLERKIVRILPGSDLKAPFTSALAFAIFLNHEYGFDIDTSNLFETTLD